MKKLFLWTFTLMLFFTWAVALADTTSVLLVPAKDTVIAIHMFDPFDGTYLGEFMRDSVSNTRYNAISGPDGKIYVSENSPGAIYTYNARGEFLYTYADFATDSIHYVAGIAFRGDTLFAYSSMPDSRVVMRFDGPHSRLPNFIDSLGVAVNDIFFLEDGRSLMSVASPKIVRLYNADGTPSADIITLPNSPKQIQADPQLPGAFLNITYGSTCQITDFDLDGTIQNTISFVRGSGIYRLGNGNLLATNQISSGGVYEITNAGDTVDVEFGPGFRCYYIELCVVDTTSGCEYTVGDVNGSESYNGLDITYGVAYLKGGDPPLYECECTAGNTWYVSGDVNGSCSYNGLDITYGVAFFKGGADPIPCSDCPPG